MKMNFDLFEDEMENLSNDFMRRMKDDKKKVMKMKKDFKEKTKNKVVNEKKKLYNFVNKEYEVELT